MKKKLILFLTLLITFNNYCQSNSGKVIYKIKSIDFVSQSKINKNNELHNEVQKIAEMQIFILEFNQIKSKFFLDEVLNKNDNYRNKILKRMASVRFTSDFNYYLDKNNKYMYIEKGDGSLIKKLHEDKNWEISPESKSIGDYLCYKAIYIKKYTGRNGKNISIPITAWFAPGLPYSYGPKDYNGLPGLILELTEKETTYYATNISITTDKELKIDFPKGKTITEEEYEKKVLSNLK